jgi:type I restriction enzyme, S subunit
MNGIDDRECGGAEDDQGVGMKEGWQTKKLREVCELVNGRAYSKPELLAAGKYRVLRVGNFFTNDHWYYSDMELEEKKYCDNGDLLYAWSASFGPRIWTGGKVIYHYHIWKVVHDCTQIDQMFLFYFFQWDTEKIKEDQGTGTTMMHVSMGSMNERDLHLPPLPEQQRIVALLDEAFAGLATAKANAERNLQNARAIFESHLQSVFSQRGEGWVEKKLEEIGRTQTGSTPKTSDNSNYGDFIAFVKPGDFKVDGTLDYGKDGLSKTGAHGARIVPAESVLMVCIGATIGKCGYSDRAVTTNQQVNALTPSDGSSKESLVNRGLNDR